MDFGTYNKRVLIEQYNKNDEMIQNAERSLGKPLEVFYDHYINNHYESLVKLETKLLSIFNTIKNTTMIHSIKSRVKEPYHLLDKLIRKSINTSYAGMDISNYHYYIDDLLGIRLLLLYNDGWLNVHKAILNKFKFDTCNFVKKGERNVYNGNYVCLMDYPEVNIRNGDNEDLYKSELKNGTIKINRGRYYRSIHYSVFYRGYCFEIQVRSLFDDAWGEIDHDILYPHNLSNNDLIAYSKLLNRVSGTANEMSSYFKNVIAKAMVETTRPTIESVPNELHGYYQQYDRQCGSNSDNNINNMEDILNSINGR